MTAVESWAPVLDWEGFYEVSDLGRVRSLNRTAVNKNGRCYQVRGRILKAQVGIRGYYEVVLQRQGVRRSAVVHVLVLAAFVGRRPSGQYGLHRNGRKTDNRLANLRWGTSSDNSHDMVRHGVHNNARKTHCVNGHELVPENIVASRHGFRHCRICARARKRQWDARQAAS